MPHDYLEGKFYEWREPLACPRCGSENRELDLGPPCFENGPAPPHFGKIGHKCNTCGHVQPLVLARHKAL